MEMQDLAYVQSYSPRSSCCGLVAQPCPTLCDPIDCSLPGSSVHGISQARVLERGCHFPTPGDLPDPEIEPTSSALVGKFSTAEPPGKSLTPSTWAVFLFYDWKSHVKSYIIPCKVYLKECTLPHTITMYLHSYSEKAMAPQSSTLAWQIPWTEEPGGLQSVGSRRVGHN